MNLFLARLFRKNKLPGGTIRHLLYVLLLIFAASQETIGQSAASPGNVSSGLVLWLDASDVNGNGTQPLNGSAVPTWKDKSSAANSAVVHTAQNAAVWLSDQVNGKPVMRFTRVNDAQGSVYRTPLDLRASVNPVVTIFTVYRQGLRSGNQAVWGIDNGAWDRFFMTVWFGSENGIVPFGPAPPYNTTVQGSGTLNAVRLLTANYTGAVSGPGATNASAVYFNGNLVTAFTDNTHPTDAQGNFYIGWDGDNSAYHGDIAEVIAYNRKLSACELLYVNNYLADKYGQDFNSFKVTVASGNSFLNDGQSVTLSASTGASYKWYKNGVEIPGATQSTLTTSMPGAYHAGITNNGGCLLTTSPINVIINYAPTDVALSEYVFNENNFAGAFAADLSSNDVNMSDNFSYELVYGTGAADNARFTINNGKLFFNEALDFESQSNYSIRIRTTDSGGLQFEKAVVVTVNDINDAPRVPEEQMLYINENSPSGAVVGTVAASDDEGSSLFWSITGGNERQLFDIDPSTGKITLVAESALNYEVEKVYSLWVKVSDGALETDPVNIVVYVNDVNDSPIVSVEGDYLVDENSSKGKFVGTLLAWDEDFEASFGGWTILTGNTDGLFTLHPETGEISVNTAALDYESETEYSLQVTVSDGKTTATPATIKINIKDLNEAPAISPGQSFTIAENSASGTAVGVVTATDPDASFASNWDITEGNIENAFSIDQQSGKISVSNAAAIDFEKRSSITLTLTVSDGTLTSEKQTVVVSISNVNDNPPVIQNAVFEIPEFSPRGSEIGTLAANDEDGSTQFSAWTIINGNIGGAFILDPATGVLSVASFNAIDYETRSAYTLEIRVSDGTNSSETSTIDVFVVDQIEKADGNPVIYDAFSPNGDNINDTWNIPYLVHYPDSEVKVYNTDGVELFHNRGYTRQWDGTWKGRQMPVGTYYYVVKVDQKRVYKGQVMIIK